MREREVARIQFVRDPREGVLDDGHLFSFRVAFGTF